jgi:hypothetical protein
VLILGKDKEKMRLDEYDRLKAATDEVIAIFDAGIELPEVGSILNREEIKSSIRTTRERIKDSPGYSTLDSYATAQSGIRDEPHLKLKRHLAWILARMRILEHEFESMAERQLKESKHQDVATCHTET